MNQYVRIPEWLFWALAYCAWAGAVFFGAWLNHWLWWKVMLTVVIGLVLMLVLLATHRKEAK